MVIRTVNRDDGNRVVIKHIYPATGEYVCKVQLIEDEQIIQENDNIVFPADSFELTQEEKDELGVIREEDVSDN